MPEGCSIEIGGDLLFAEQQAVDQQHPAQQ